MHACSYVRTVNTCVLYKICVYVCVSVCGCMCVWQRAPEILCCVQGTHAGSPKVPLCACPDYALRIGNVET